MLLYLAEITMIKIFEFADYKKYLTALEAERASYQRGFRSRIAEVLDCQNAYVSQVLNTHAHFSLEQTHKIALFLTLNEVDTHYLILLVEYARAGTNSLKEFFKKELKVIREKYFDIKERVPGAKFLSVENQNVYYSSWLYPTIHMLITIPEFRTFSKIAIALKLDDSLTREIILFLISAGLVIESKGELHPGATQIHLSKDSTSIRHHHTNWRLAAVQSLHTMKKTDIHYSTVSSLSLTDAEKLKSKFLQLIEEYVQTIGPSKEETLYNFNLDFYNLLR
jgi:uncharacterized protein (TIGR02147 family)